MHQTKSRLVYPVLYLWKVKYYIPVENSPYQFYNT